MVIPIETDPEQGIDGVICHDGRDLESLLIPRDMLHRAAVGARESLIERSIWRGCSREMAGQVVDGIASILPTTSIVFWKEELFQAAVQGCEAFLDAPLEAGIRPPEAQLWLPEVCPRLDSGVMFEELQLERPADLLAMLVIPIAPDGISICYVLYPGVPLRRKANGDLESTGDMPEDMLHPILRWVPGVRVGQPISAWLIQVTACLKFIETKIVVPRREALPRPTRRRIQKAGSPEPAIYSIALRRVAGHPENASPFVIEREYRWMVRGHWRKQWVGPRTNPVQSPTFVKPHIKGPDDRPLKPHREGIYVVNR